MIAQSTIERIKDLSLVDVVRKYSEHELKKKGASLQGLSPFTNEKTPSFYVVPSKNIYKCFSSGKGGNNPIAFVMELKGMEFYDAIHQLAGDFAITIEYENIDPATAKKQQTDKKNYDKLLRAANRQFIQALEDACDSDTYNYIFDHLGYAADDAIQWEFGLAPNKKNFLTSKVIQSELYQEALTIGLIGEKEGVSYDVFRARWVFPIYNHFNQLVGFAGRIMAPDSKYPKYINSKESPVFSKSKILFGLNHAQEEIKKAGFAYLVEGYTDVFTWHQAGVRNTVASCGTSFTREQAQLLKKYTETVMVCFDGDDAGQKKALDTIEILLQESLYPELVLLPHSSQLENGRSVGIDPDSFGRALRDKSETFYPQSHLFSRKEVYSGNSIHDLLSINKHDALEYYIDVTFLPSRLSENAHDKQKALDKIAGIIGYIGKSVVIDDYSKYIAKKYDFRVQTVRAAVDQAKEAHQKHIERQEYKTHVKKNRVVKLDGDPKVFPFFEEKVNKKGEFKELRINKLKFVKLMASFGYSRYELNGTATPSERSYTFVKIEDNIITHSSKEGIIDELEEFIEKEYDFVGAGCDITDSEMLINKLYDGIRTYFNKDLFYRVRQEDPIIINTDRVDRIYFYFSNGFVEVTDEKFTLRPYDEMPGSVWNHQKLNREFKPIEGFAELKIDRQTTGVVSDFVWKISNQDADRFDSLITIIGFLLHDFYDYKLKAVNFTDSSLAEEADGRSGKTLLSQIIGWVRSYTEINGKDFNPNDKGKYEGADLGTQVLHINDVLSTGQNKFLFEYIFNDVTEGYMVKKLYMQPFRNRSKIIVSSNSPIDVRGGSQKDRIIEYELSNYFSADYSPEDEYKMWFGRDFDDVEWQKTYNFMCICAMAFLYSGLKTPKTINLELRKLLQYTSKDFLEFMREIEENCKQGNEKDPYTGYFAQLSKHNLTMPLGTWSDIRQFPRFDKKILKDLFEGAYEDYQNQKWFTSKMWTKWLRDYSEKALGVKKPIETRANGRNWIQFTETPKEG